MSKKEPFMVLDNGGETTDRYTVICTIPIYGAIQYVAFGDRGRPHEGQIQIHNWNERKGNVRDIGRRLRLEQLPMEARRIADEFISNCERSL